MSPESKDVLDHSVPSGFGHWPFSFPILGLRIGLWLGFWLRVIKHCFCNYQYSNWTTKKPTATAKALPSGKTVVFPKLRSLLAGYKYTKVFGVAVFADTSVNYAKLEHVASIMAEWFYNDKDGCVDTAFILKHLMGKTSKEEIAYAVFKSNKAKADWYVPFDKKKLFSSAPQTKF